MANKKRTSFSNSLVNILLLLPSRHLTHHSIGTPMTMDEFAWSESDAVLYLGIAMSAGGVMALCTFVAIGRLAQRFDERKLLILCGIIPMMIGRALMMPWPNGPDIKMADHSEDTTTVTPATQAGEWWRRCKD